MNNSYTIREFSEKTGLTAHTLRYYERIGLLDGVARDEHGYRLYRESDLSGIEFLMRLKETGMPIGDMRRFSGLRSRGETTITERREMLEAHQERIRAQIRALGDNLTSIGDKIDHYKSLEAKASSGSNMLSEN